MGKLTKNQKLAAGKKLKQGKHTLSRKLLSW